MIDRRLIAHAPTLADANQPVALEGFLAASPSINRQRGLADLALSTTRNVVELPKKGCIAIFRVSGEFALPTIAVLQSAAARMVILNAAGRLLVQAQRRWISAFRCASSAVRITQ